MLISRHFSVSFNACSKFLFTTQSLLVNNDKIGVQTNLSAYLGYTYRINTNHYETSKISFGLSLGFMQSGLEGNLLTSDEKGDSYNPLVRQSSLLPDARAGMLFTSDFFFIGFSANNIFAAALAKKDSDTKELTPKPHLYLQQDLFYQLAKI